MCHLILNFSLIHLILFYDTLYFLIVESANNNANYLYLTVNIKEILLDGSTFF